MKKRSTAIFSGIGIIFMIFASTPVRADDDMDPNDAAEKARQAHDKAGSDMIYQQEDFKALYYQNVQIIQLLKEIRDSLDALKARDAVKNAEEKKI